MTRFRQWDKWIAPREVTMTTNISPDAIPVMDEWLASVPTERDIRVTLNDGAQWPKQVRRGKAVVLSFGSHVGTMTLVGKVRFRRLNTAVFRGHVTVRQ